MAPKASNAAEHTTFRRPTVGPVCSYLYEWLYCSCLEELEALSEGGVDQSGEEWQDVMRDILERGGGSRERVLAWLDVTSVRTGMCFVTV